MKRKKDKGKLKKDEKRGQCGKRPPPQKKNYWSGNWKQDIVSEEWHKERVKDKRKWNNNDFNKKTENKEYRRRGRDKKRKKETNKNISIKTKKKKLRELKMLWR